MINLRDVTLVGISSNKISETIDAFRYSTENIRFADSIFISPHKIDTPSFVRHEQSIVSISNYNEYNYYCIYHLVEHIKTKHCLLIQWDGYVTHPEKWDQEFLNYDYIGAPWQISNSAYIDPYGNHIRVGNGGFSLRSSLLLYVPKLTHEDGTSIVEWNVNQGDFYKHFNYGAQNEDGIICVHNRHVFESYGCIFAPVDVAARFSQELEVPEAAGITPFGFHRYKR